MWMLMLADDALYMCVCDADLSPLLSLQIDLHGKDKNSSVQDHRQYNKQTLVYNAKLAQAHVTLARTSDFGNNDTQFETMTHLGNLLSPGDTVMGYDLTNANWNDQVPLTRVSSDMHMACNMQMCYIHNMLHVHNMLHDMYIST